MLPRRLIIPPQTSMDSVSIVFPDDAWPATAKLRISEGWYVFVSIMRGRSGYVRGYIHKKGGSRQVFSEKALVAVGGRIPGLSGAKRRMPRIVCFHNSKLAFCAQAARKGVVFRPRLFVAMFVAACRGRSGMKSAKSWVSEGEWVFCRRDPAQFLQSGCANPLAIVALAFCLLLTRVPVASGHSCPGDATAIRIGLSVSVTHPNDQPLATTGCVPGDELWVRVAL